MENKEASSVLGNAATPYANQLATQYASATHYYAIRHPSLPNYLALIGGDNFGVTSDCTTCFIQQDNLAAQLEAKGRSWKAYMETMPTPCFVGNIQRYAQKHNPFIYCDNIRNDPARCHKIVPLSELDRDLQTNTLPDFVWITPNLCNDTHDCPVATGDHWLLTWVPKLLATAAWQQPGVLFITYDEGSSDQGCCQLAVGGQIMTLVISPLVQPGFVSHVPSDHYSLLRTIEVAWQLPLWGQANCDCSVPMTDFLVKPLGHSWPGGLNRSSNPYITA
ncbi:phosphatidylinositol-3-phosphatase [soil metagenome]